MMKKIYLFSVFISLFVFSAMAQSGSISGTLIDAETEEPVPFVNVRVLQQADSTLVTGIASGEDGTFTIPVANGTFIVQMSFIGFHDVFRNVEITPQAPRVQLGNIALTADVILLDEAIVTASIPEVIMRGDTIEFHADAFRVPEGSAVVELLRQMPGVEVSEEGRISVNGRAVDRIRVDDEEFFSTDPTFASENLPARMVERVQAMERRSDRAQMTGFDDGEEEFILNLTTRPGMREMIIGEGRVGYGSLVENFPDPRQGARGFFNYSRNQDRYTAMVGLNNTNNIGFTGGMGGRGGGGGGGGNRGISTLGDIGGDFNRRFSPQFQLGGGARYGYNDRVISSSTLTQRFLDSGNRLEDESSWSNNIGHNHSMNLRMEWRPDTLTTIIFRPTASYNRTFSSDGADFSTREIIDDAGGDIIAGDTINYGFRESHTARDVVAFGGNLNVSRTIGRPGRVLNLELGGNVSNSGSERYNESANIFRVGTRPDDFRNHFVTDTVNNRSWRGSLSFVEPISENHFIQLAYTLRQNFSESNRVTHSWDDATQNWTIPEPSFTRRNVNHFTNHVAELNFRAVHGIVRYTVGFTVRPSSSRNQTSSPDPLIRDRDTTIHIINYAPVARLNIRWNRNHTLEVRYSGTTGQPSIDQLSPVLDLTNPLNIRIGNENLRPSFEHEIDIRYHLSNPEAGGWSLRVNAEFEYLTNAIVDSSYTDATGFRTTSFANVPSGNWGAEGNATFNMPLWNNFRLTASSRIIHDRASGFINGVENQSRRTNFRQTLGLTYRTDFLNIDIRGNITPDRVQNTLEGQRDRNSSRYGGSVNVRAFLPWRLTIASDITYSASSGLGDANFEEWMWNASVQKTLFRQNNGTLSFDIFDILQQRRNVSRSVTANFIRDTTTTNMLTSFFMVSFNYRFNIFRGGATRENMMPRGGGDRPGGGGERVIIGPGGGGGERVIIGGPGGGGGG